MCDFGDSGKTNPIKPNFTPIASYALWEKVEPTRPYVQVAVLMGRLIWAGFLGKLISVDH